MSAAGFPSKSGGVNLEDYTTNGMILEFGPIAAALQTEFDNTGTNPVLEACHISELVASIINFQEKHCGFNSPQPRAFTRFPFEIFRDYNLHGHLHRLLRFMISYCAKQEWYRNKYSLNEENTSNVLINLYDDSLIDEYFVMFKHIENLLKKQQIIRSKVVFFSPLISVKSQQNLARIARAHGAQISDELTARVTHIILPNNADMEDSGEEHVRTIGKQDNLAYIHYWFYPSSYDQWISNDLIDGDAEHIEPPVGAWRVGERFMTDLDQFNEWMVELDYEVLEVMDIEPQIAVNEKRNNNNGYGANISNQNEVSRKRKRVDNVEKERGVQMIEDDKDDPDGDWIPPLKKPKTNNNNFHDFAPSNSSAAKKKLKFSLKRRKNPATHITKTETIRREISAKKKGADPQLNGGDIFPFAGASLSRIRPMISTYPIVIPSYARWFRLDRIHPIEYQSLNSLFSRKAMQYHERYLDIRNFIVNSYRINPRIYLTVTAARRIIAADAGSVYRIHKFLQDWGLINYQVDDGTIPEFDAPLVDYTHVDTPFGVRIAAKMKGKKEKEIAANNGDNNGDDAFSLRENMFCVDDGHKNNGENVCSFCGICCAQSRYRCNVEKDLILCCKCFDARRYSMIFNENDFEMELLSTSSCSANHNEKQMISRKQISQWTEEELKKLKYAIKTWHDDWNRVSEFVGRNEEECIAQFVQLPIKDAFIENVESAQATNESHPLHDSQPSPFNDAQHPILAQCASLSAIVDSELVAIASSAALQFVSKQKVCEANSLSVNACVDTKMGRGVIEHIVNKNEYQIAFEWGSTNLKFDDIIDVVAAGENNENVEKSSSWLQYPQNVNSSKAKAAGILASSAIIAKALKHQKDRNIEQLLQHLVLLQSQKVKAKLAHLDSLCAVLQREKKEIGEMKQELFRERIEIAKQRLDRQQLQNDDDDDDDGDADAK